MHDSSVTLYLDGNSLAQAVYSALSPDGADGVDNGDAVFSPHLRGAAPKIMMNIRAPPILGQR